MAYEPIFDIAGNLLGDPELRFTPNGVAVCNFRVGINDGRPEQNNGKQVQPLIAEVTVWRDMAEHVAESLEARARITAKVRMTEIGAYIAKNDDKNGFYKAGDPVGTLKVEALEIGPSLRWANAQVTKVAGGGRNQNQGGGNQQGGGQQGGWGGNQGQQGGWGGAPSGGGQQGGDPWAGGQHPGQQGGGQPAQQGQGGGWGSDQAWGNGGQQGGDPWGQ